MPVGDDRKIWPNRPIQETLSDRLNDRWDAQDIDPMLFLPKDEIVCKKRNSHDMVKVGMRDEDMRYRPLPSDVENIGEASRIEKDFFIQQETRRTMFGKLCA